MGHSMLRAVGGPRNEILICHAESVTGWMNMHGQRLVCHAWSALGVDRCFLNKTRSQTPDNKRKTYPALCNVLVQQGACQMVMVCAQQPKSSEARLKRPHTHLNMTGILGYSV